jgi:hypothetical protein
MGQRFGGTHSSPDFKCGFRLAALDRERDVHDVSARQKVATHLLDHQGQHAAAHFHVIGGQARDTPGLAGHRQAAAQDHCAHVSVVASVAS